MDDEPFGRMLGADGHIRMSDLVRSQAMDPESGSEIERLQTKVLQRHLRKTVLEYTITFTDGSTKTYVGVHRESDPRLAHTFCALQSLRKNGFDDEDELRVPQPILFVPSLSFLLMSRADGVPLRSILADPARDAVPALQAAARFLVKLHASSAEFGRVRTAEDEVRSVRLYWEAIPRIFPERSLRVESISRRLIHAWLTEPRSESRPVHGDYHPKNVIASAHGISVVDFDECCMGDPALDLGYFVAQAKMTHGFTQRIETAAAAFVGEYVRRVQVDPAFATRVALHEAQTYLQRIYHTYVLLQLKPDRELVARWLDQSERSLPGGRP